MKRLLIILSKDHTLHEMMIGITMANIVLAIIALFVPDRRHALYAVAVGLAISLLYVIHMAVTLDDALNLDEKSAVAEVRKHMVIRYVLTGVAVGVTVTNESIPILERAQDEVLTKAMKDLCDQMKDHGAAVANELEYQSGVFIDKISATIKENHKKLERLIQDQARSLAEMDQFLKEIDEAKRKIREAE